MHLSGIRRLAVIATAATTAAITIQPVSYAQVVGEKPTVCQGFYSHVPDGFHPDSRKQFDSYPFSVEVRAEAIKIQWFDHSDSYVEKLPSVGEIVSGYDAWVLGRFRILCGDKGTVVLVSDGKNANPNDNKRETQTLKLFRSRGDIFDVAAQRGWSQEGEVELEDGTIVEY